MEIFLLRHGLAVERGTPGFKNDSARPLAPKGIKQLKKVSRAMAEMDLEFDLILSSPFLRAQATAEMVAAGLKSKKRLKFSHGLATGKKPAPFYPGVAKAQTVAGKDFIGWPRTIFKPADFAAHHRRIGLCSLDFAKGGLANWRWKHCALENARRSRGCSHPAR